MSSMFEIKMTKKAEKAFREIAKTDKALFAEINEKIRLLREGKHDRLDIDHIRRKKEKHRIMEIRILSPNSYRIFYVSLAIESNTILLVDGRKKKVDKFDSEYFKTLDRCIDNEILK